MPKPAVLPFAELAKIDQLSYEKANRILKKPKPGFGAFDYI